VVVLDEAGIVDTRKLYALITHAALSRTALVLSVTRASYPRSKPAACSPNSP
jgi:hypothetical protein